MIQICDQTSPWIKNTRLHSSQPSCCWTNYCPLGAASRTASICPHLCLQLMKRWELAGGSRNLWNHLTVVAQKQQEELQGRRKTKEEFNKHIPELWGTPLGSPGLFYLQEHRFYFLWVKASSKQHVERTFKEIRCGGGVFWLCWRLDLLSQEPFHSFITQAITSLVAAVIVTVANRDGGGQMFSCGYVPTSLMLLHHTLLMWYPGTSLMS